MSNKYLSKPVRDVKTAIQIRNNTNNQIQNTKNSNKKSKERNPYQAKQAQAGDINEDVNYIGGILGRYAYLASRTVEGLESWEIKAHEWAFHTFVGLALDVGTFIACGPEARFDDLAKGFCPASNVKYIEEQISTKKYNVWWYRWSTWICKPKALRKPTNTV